MSLAKRFKQDLRHFGIMIRIQRQVKGWNQTQLGKKVGLSRVVISNLERGLANTTVTKLFRFAYVFKCPPARLLRMHLWSEDS